MGGSTPLHKAAFQGDADILQMIIDAGADLDAVDHESATALHKGAFKGNTAVIRTLLDRGAKLDVRDAQGGTALYNACYNGYVKSVEMLLQTRDKAEVHKMINLPDEKGRGPLHAAACFGHWEVTSLLVKNDASLDLQDEDGMTPLHLAAFNGSQLSVAFLLEKGADVSKKNKDGITALHYSSYNGHIATVHHLVKCGAPINDPDNNGVTPLHYAAACNHWDVVAYLLYMGADVDPKTDEGMTPLAYATRNGALDAVVSLLERGADPDIKDKKGNSARTLSKRTKNNPTKRIYDSIGKLPFSAEAMARLSDFRDKKLRHRKRAGEGEKRGVNMTIDATLSPDLTEVSSPFTDIGFDFDLNDPKECIQEIYREARRIKHNMTCLNLLRLLLLISEDKVVGGKQWQLIEMFAHQITVNEPTKTSKVQFQEFLDNHKVKDALNKAKKLDMLVGVENALPIMFPNMPPMDPDSDVTFRVAGMPEPESDSDVPAAKRKAAKRKKKKKRGDAGEYSEEEEEDEDGRKKKRGWDDEYSEDEDEEEDSDEADFNFDDYDEEDIDWNAPPKTTAMGDPNAPPPLPGGAPPPPPPPGMPGAPPLPGMMKPKGPKMRKFNWTKIPRPQIPTTLWRHLQPQGVPIDEGMIMEYFKIPEDKDKKKKKEKKKVTNIVDLKRANHIGLLLNMIKMTPRQVKKAVLEVKDSLFTEEQLKGFLKLTPKSSDIELLKPYLSAPRKVRRQLGEAEQFYLEIMGIPRLENRLMAMLFKKTFENQIDGTRGALIKASNIVNELKTNVKFAKILELILNIGNRLNQGTMAGNALGFTLDSLPKLRDTRSPTHENYNLMNYVTWMVTKKRPKLLAFREELGELEEGSSEHLVMINAEFQELKAGMSNLQNELKAISELENKGPGEEFFEKKMRVFASKAVKELKQLQEDVDRLNNDTKLMYQHYGADKKIDVVLEVQTFIRHFNLGIVENKEIEKRRKMRAKKKKRTVMKSKGTSTGTKRKGMRTPGTLDEDDEWEYEYSDEEEPDVEKYFPGKGEGSEDEYSYEYESYESGEESAEEEGSYEYVTDSGGEEEGEDAEEEVEVEYETESEEEE